MPWLRRLILVLWRSPAYPWLLNSLLGAVAGLYAWQFLATNRDFTGPLPVGLPAGLALTFLAGPLVVVGVQAMSALLLARWSGRPFRECLRRDALSLLPLGLLGLSPLLGLLTGFHTTAYHAGVVVLVSLVFGACLALKAVSAWQILRGDGQRPGVDERTARWVLIGLIAVYALVFSTLQVLRYNAYQLWGVDHSLVTQALWNTLHGRFLTYNFVGGAELNLLADHFEPIFLLLLPLYALWSDPRLPLIVQAVLLSAAAWPVYQIALRRLSSPALALGWALTYLLLPMTVAAAQDSAGAVRPDALAIPIFLWMLDALDRRNWAVFGVTVVLAFAAKEYLSLLVAMLGLYIAIRQKRPVLGGGLFLAGVLWFVALLQWVMPAFRAGPSLTLTIQYGSAAGEAGLAGLAQTLLQDPGRLLAQVFSYGHLLFLFFWVFSFAGLPLLDPFLAAVSLPIFAIFVLTLSQMGAAVNLGNHRYYPALPFFVAAAISGVAAARRWAGSRRAVNPRLAPVALTAFAIGMGLAAGFFWASGPLSWRFWDRSAQGLHWGDRYRPSAHTRLAGEFVRSVPDEVPVLASDYLLAHLANRPEVYHFFWPPDDVLERVEYVVVDLLENQVGWTDARARNVQLLGDLLDSEDFGLTAYEDGLLLFRRGAADGYRSQAVVMAETPQPQVRVERDLGNRLRLLGYDPPVAPLRAGERCRITYYWQVLAGFATPFDLMLGVSPESVETHRADYVLADRFVGPAGTFAVLHLPTYAQMPPGEWQAGQVIRETYDFRLPANASGAYDWSVGLYAAPRSLGIRIEPDRLVPDVAPIPLGTLAVES